LFGGGAPEDSPEAKLAQNDGAIPGAPPPAQASAAGVWEYFVLVVYVHGTLGFFEESRFIRKRPQVDPTKPGTAYTYDTHVREWLTCLGGCAWELASVANEISPSQKTTPGAMGRGVLGQVAQSLGTGDKEHTFKQVDERGQRRYIFKRYRAPN
jgi:hypothetical protein